MSKLQSKSKSHAKLQEPILASDLPAGAHAPFSLARSLRILIPLAASLMLSACAGSGLELAALATADPANASAASSNASSIETGALSKSSANGEQKAGDKTAAQPTNPSIVKARGLRANGDLTGAMAVLEEAAKGSDDPALLRERGLLALELGRIKDAKRLLAKADKAGPPDWRIKSALGSAYSASGEQQSAQHEFAAALKLAPDHPSILNNLALSYALEGRHAQAEKLLRTAAQSSKGDPKAKQNLALLLGLHGNLDEARKVSEASLPKDVSSSNMSYLEQLKTAEAQVSRAKRQTTSDSVATTTNNGSAPDN